MADNRLGDYFRPDLWRAYGPQQIYVVFLSAQPISAGPALTSAATVPDLNFYRGSCSGRVCPLYRTADASEANILPGLLDLLENTYGQSVSPEDFVAYVYGLLAQPAFTKRFFEELETRELRVPLTKDYALFQESRQIGAKLLWLHTYGERFVPADMSHSYVPPGRAKCMKAVPGDPNRYPECFDYNDTTKVLRVGVGEFAPVAPEVFEFEVSGLKVVQSWLNYRMKGGAGRKSSPLDDIGPESWPSQFTTELLELIWVLEKTVAGYSRQAQLLKAVVAGECFKSDELPSSPEYMRKPPKKQPYVGTLFEL